MTDAEAEAMLAQLSAHYRVPVMPIERYCEALNTWATCIGERASTLKAELYPNIHAEYWKDESLKPLAEAAVALYHEERKNRNEAQTDFPPRKRSERDHQLDELRRFEQAAEMVNFVFLQIRKSSLLARTLYDGQKVRTRRCPEHKGHWSGLESPPDRYCKHGCGFFGWLPEPEDASPYPIGVYAVTERNADDTWTHKLMLGREQYFPKDGEPPYPPPKK